MNIEWSIVLSALGLLAVVVALLWSIAEREDWPSFIIGFLALVLFFCLINAGVMSVGRLSCRVFAEVNSWDHQYSYTNKCLVEVEPGRWIPKLAVYSQVEDLPQ